ncbi:MAG: hypothetical protein WCQ16_11435 [Verrucomicrobiae bacterium]
MIQAICDIATTFATLLLAAIAIWQEQIVNFLNPSKAVIEKANFDGQLEGTQTEPSYTYHIKARCLTRFRSLRGCRIVFREVVRKLDAGNEIRSNYPVWRQLPWAPSERTEFRVTISSEQEADAGIYYGNEDVYVIPCYVQGGVFDSRVQRGERATVRLHLMADNMIHDITALLVIDMRGVPKTKPKLEIQNG